LVDPRPSWPHPQPCSSIVRIFGSFRTSFSHIGFLMELPGRSKLRCGQGKQGFASWGGTLRRGASNTAVRSGGGGLSDAAVPPLAPTGGVLSEGEKRDSKGDMPDPLCRSPRLVNPRGDTREASACRGDFAPEPASRTRPRRILLSSGQRVGVPPSVLLALKRLLVGAGAPGSGWSRLPGDSLRCVSRFPRDPLPGSASCFNCFSAGELLTF